MAKDTFWFKHDYNARNDEKILVAPLTISQVYADYDSGTFCRSSAQGWFWCLPS